MKANQVANGTVYCDFRIKIVDCEGEEFYQQVYLGVAVVGIIIACLSFYLFVINRKMGFVRNGRLSPVPVGAVGCFFYGAGVAIHAFLLIYDLYQNNIQREIMFALPPYLLYTSIAILIESIILTVRDTYPKMANILPNQGMIKRFPIFVLFYLTAIFLIFAIILGWLEDVNHPAQNPFFCAYYAIAGANSFFLGAISFFFGWAFYSATNELMRRDLEVSASKRTRDELQKIYMAIVVMTGGFNTAGIFCVLLAANIVFTIVPLSQATFCFLVLIPEIACALLFLIWSLLHSFQFTNLQLSIKRFWRTEKISFQNGSNSAGNTIDLRAI